MNRHSALRAVLVATAFGCLVGAAFPAAGTAARAAGRRPNLVVTAVSVSSTSAVPGSRLKVFATIANRGSAPSKRTSTGFLISQGSASAAGAIRLGGSIAVPPLKPGATSTGHTTATIPSWAPTGHERLYACTDLGHAVTESNEKDNCRAVTKPFRLVAHPLTAALQLDAKHQTTTILTWGTGTLQTTDRRGDAFTLTIPTGALLSPEKVRMIPVLAISKLPWTAKPVPVVGVRLEPSGLILNQTATLTIRPSHAVPLRDQHGLAFEGAGAQIHRMPLDPSTQTIQFDVSHFSGDVIMNTSPGNLVEVQADVPSAPAFQLENTLAAPVEQYRTDGESHGVLEHSLVDPIQKFFDDVIGPQLRDASKIDLGDDAAEDAVVGPEVVAALSWARQLEILGMGDLYRNDISWIFKQLGLIEAHQFNLAYKRCRANQNPRHQLTRMISAARQIGLSSNEMGIAELLGADYWDKVTACAGDYQLTMSGTADATWKTTQFTTWWWKSTTASVQANRIPLRLDQNSKQGDFTGGGPGTPLTVDSAKGTPWVSSCKQGPRYKISSYDQAKSYVQAAFWPDLNMGVPNPGGLLGVAQVIPFDYENVQSLCADRTFTDGEQLFNQAWQATMSGSGAVELSVYYPGTETSYAVTNDVSTTTTSLNFKLDLAGK